MIICALSAAAVTVSLPVCSSNEMASVLLNVVVPSFSYALSVTLRSRSLPLPSIVIAAKETSSEASASSGIVILVVELVKRMLSAEEVRVSCCVLVLPPIFTSTVAVPASAVTAGVMTAS